MQIDQSFTKDFEMLKTTYDNRSFHRIEPEKTDAFNEWYEEKDVVNVVKSMNNLSEQVKSRIENEKKYQKEQAETRRLAKETEDAIKTDEMTLQEILLIVMDIKERYENANPPSRTDYSSIINTVAQIATTVVLPVLSKFI